MPDAAPPTRDPTRVTSQPALTTERPRWWYLWGGLFAAVSVAVLLWLLARQPVVAIVGVALVVLLYAAMLVVGMTIRPAGTRNLTFAWLMGTMALAAVAAVATIMVIEWM